MAMSEMTDSMNENKEFHFKDAFKIGYICPFNTLKVKLSLDWLENVVEVDWAVVFLAVGGNYISYRSIFDFALDQLGDSSEKAVQELALSAYESHPDYSVADSYVNRIMSEIDLEMWALAFLKLFFAILKWFCTNVDIAEKDYQYQLDCLCYDFCEIEIKDKAVDFPYLSVCNIVDDIDVKRKLQSDYESAADKYLNILSSIDPYSDEFKAVLDAVTTAWNNYGDNDSKRQNF